jgi:hypothetical protein
LVEANANQSGTERDHCSSHGGICVRVCASTWVSRKVRVRSGVL